MLKNKKRWRSCAHNCCSMLVLWEELQMLKQKRRALYGRIKALRRCWFGYLANVEKTLASDWNGWVVRERLTLKPLETGSEVYKGKAFNRMLRNGARGIFEQLSTQKLDYWGVRKVVVGAWYTSTICIKHSRVDKRM
ncbi:MAG: hypothetical protein AAGJ35_11700, partial [Myxococcota bacterium]